ncbi:MAG: hypothetical protein ACI9R3_004819 [Verrucomicrobiales bacterium]|jgi:hypothetical protein
MIAAILWPMRKSFLLLFLGQFVITTGAATAQFSGIGTWDVQKSDRTSASLRSAGKSYIQKLEFVRPSPATTADQLETINPSLPKILPGFRKLMETARVSSRYKELYDRKTALIKRG